MKQLLYWVFCLFVIGVGSVSCSSDALPEPNSYLIAGEWRMDSVLRNQEPITRDYSSYRLTFRRGGEYLLINEFGETSFGRWVMEEDGNKLILDYYTEIESTLTIEELTEQKLQLIFARPADTTTFTLGRLRL